MDIKKDWWKIIGIILMIYSFIFGLLIPLGPGVLSVFPFNGVAGNKLSITLEGYNTHFTEAKNQRIWLKLEDYSLSATALNPTSSNQMEVSFNLPKSLPTEDSIASFSLIIDNEIDGAFVMPNAVFIKQSIIDFTKGTQLWKDNTLENLHRRKGITFPFRNVLSETIRNLYFHVSLWFGMFALLGVAVAYSIKYLRNGDITHDYRATALITVGVVYGLLGCLTGSIWAKHTWGTWWTTDVKLNMTAVFMLIYLAFFVLRGSFQDEIKRGRLSAVYNVFAFASLIPLLFVIPRLVDSLHPGNGGNPGFGGEDLDNSMRMVFYPAIIGITLIGFWIAELRYRIALLSEKILDRQ